MTPGRELNGLGAGAAAIKTAWEEHLSGYLWTHFVTLTYGDSFGYRITEPKASRDFLNWTASLRRKSQGKVHWFRSIEWTTRDHPHLHALVWMEKPLGGRTMDRAWYLGHTKIERYYPFEGAAAYVVKAVAVDDLYDCSLFHSDVPIVND